MKTFKPLTLHATLYQKAFKKILKSIPKNSQHLDVVKDAEATCLHFCYLLSVEEDEQQLCTPAQASHEGEQVLLLLECLSFIMEDTLKNRQLIYTLAMSTGMWVAQRKGEVRELGMIVNAITSFASYATHKQELENLYEISLHILYATEELRQTNKKKQDIQRFWRLLCLNHCSIATRTGNGELAKLAYDRLVKYLPDEAENFFTIGMQQMDYYSAHCREVLQVYYQMYSSKYRRQPVGINVSLI